MSSIVSALVSLLTGTKASLSDGELTEVILGPVSEESKKISADVPMSAVENGTEVGDHIHTKPSQFSVNTIFTDSSDLISAALSALSGGSMSVSDKIKTLEDWQKSGTLLTYSGPVFSSFLHSGYDMIVSDVVISDLSITRNNDTGAGVLVGIQLSKIPMATAAMTTIELPKALSSKTNKGVSATGTAQAAGSSGNGAAGGSSSILAKMML